ncbi:MAG: outer membrane protein assembly factor BamC [Cytophagales bacterium]|nr:outer membrane protein assembly factor BamC [Cytophagales bacterium]
MMKINIWATLVFGLLTLTACTTTFEGNKVDYKSQGQVAPRLEVPPDLSQLTKNAQAFVPVGGAANASAYSSTAAQQAVVADSAVAASALGDVRVAREGTQRWLVASRPPAALWTEVRAFWVDNGFTLALDQPDIGIMETEWNENRAKIPQDWFRRTVGKVFEALYSTNERDKYRTRMEQTASGGTEIYITHRGMVEDFVTAQKEKMMWRPRPADPELEAEFLKRLMVRLGATPATAAAAMNQPATAAAGASAAKSAAPIAVAPTATTPARATPQIAERRAMVVQEGTQLSLLVREAYEQAWRRVGLSLDRTNFTVEDRDRTKGIYFVRYVEPGADKDEPGFFARLFGAKAKESLQKYQVILKSDAAASTRVQVADAAGNVLATTEAKTILRVLSDDLQ